MLPIGVLIDTLVVHCHGALRAGIIDALLGHPARWKNRQAHDWRLDAFVRPTSPEASQG